MGTAAFNFLALLFFFSPLSALGEIPENRIAEMASERYAVFLDDEALVLTSRRQSFDQSQSLILYPDDLSFFPAERPGLGIKLSPKIDQRLKTSPYPAGWRALAELIFLFGAGRIQTP